jgi:glucosamine-6-phosphate deaminase
VGVADLEGRCGVEVVIVESPDAVGELAAGIVARAVTSVSDPVIGLATGSSPVPTYRRLIALHRQDGLSFRDVRAVTLDEYVGLQAGHRESYRTVICRDLVDHLDLDAANLHSPSVDATGEGLAAACDEYDRLVAELGVDVQLLGIGTDGHIGFNEPGSSLASRTRIKTLTERTRHDNARFFDEGETVPRHVITQGLGTIREARHLVMIATGERKAAPVAAAVEGPVSAMCPASVMQLHAHVTVLVDEAAASRLQLADYYRHTYVHKPDWQPL